MRDNPTTEEESDIFITLGPFELTNEELGQGNFGVVYIGIHNETKEKVAIKVIRKKDIKVVSKKNEDEDEDDDDDDEEENKKIKEKIDKDYSELLRQEIEILQELHHPYICQFLYKTHYHEDCYIVTEYLSGKDFVDSKIEFTEQKICKAFNQILSAIEYLHKNYIVHRDIKLENILFDEYDDAKLIDFGFSKKLKINELIEGSRGSVLYAAPEILLTEKSHKYDGFLSDIWSLGVCFYFMMFRCFPFAYEDINNFYNNLQNEDLIIPKDNNISPEFKDLIKRILNKDPNKRLSLNQIKHHKWVHSLDFNFMKSPGISLNKEILPIDLDIIKEMAGNDLNNISKLIKDVLTNAHNKYTCTYYLKLSQKKRKNIKSIADIRPTSELFLNYINSEKSKLKYYNNDINKVVKELTEQIMKQKQEEEQKFNNIKNSININENNNKALLSKSIIDKDNNKTNNGLSKLRSRSFGKLKNLKKYLKEENNKDDNDEINGKKIIKVKKINILDTYRNNVIFINGIIEDIIYKALNTIKSEEKEKEKESENIQKSTELKINKNNLTINMIEEFGFAPDIKKADKTAPFGFYKQKNKLNQKNNKNIETEIPEEKIKNKLYDKNKLKNKNKKNKVETKSLMTSKYINYSSINIKRPENKKIKILKTEENKTKINNANKPDKTKKEGIIHNIKNKFSNAVKSIKDKFYKEKKKSTIQKHNIKKTKTKSQKRNKSVPIDNIKNNNIYKSIIDNDINILLSKKRPNSYKNEMKRKSANETKEKKLEKKAVKFINKNKGGIHLHNLDKDLDTNLNINKVISEKNNRNYNYSKLRKGLWKNKNKNKSNLSMTYSSSPIEIPDKKSAQRTITQERNTHNTNNPINNKAQYKRKAKIGGRTYIISHKDKSKTSKTIDDNTNITRAHKKIPSNKISSKLSPNEETPKKSNIYIGNTTNKNKKTSLKIKQSIHSSIESLSKDTIDTSSRKQIKTKRNSINKRLRTNSIESANTSNIKSNDINNKHHEIKIKKDITMTEEIISGYFGEDKMKVNKSKTGIKFVTKMFLGKKKLEFILNLVQVDRKNCSLTGELIEGDATNFEKIFSTLKEKLK